MRTWVVAALSGLLLLGLTSVPPANAMSLPLQHRVYVGYLTGQSFMLTPQQMAEGIDAALDDWRAMAPHAFGSLTRAGDPAPIALTPEQAGCRAGSRGEDPATYAQVQQAMGLGHPAPGVVEHLVIFTPLSCLQNPSGGATIGTSVNSGGLIRAVDNVDTYSVETLESNMVRYLAYNFGIGDAGIGCSPFVSRCVQIGNGDCYSVTGTFGVLGRQVLSSAERAEADILEPFELASVPVSPVPLDLTVTLRPRDESSGVRGLAVDDPVNGTTYYVDYQVVSDEPATVGLPCPDGVVVTTATDWRRATQVLPRGVVNPGSNAQLPWHVGDTIPISAAVQLQVLAADPSAGAQIRVITTPVPPFDKIGRAKILGGAAEGGFAGGAAIGFSPKPDRVSYRWFVDGRPLLDQYGSRQDTQAIQLPDQVDTLSLRLTAYHAGRAYAVVTDSLAVTQMPLRLGRRPTLRGALKAGHKVKAVFRHEPRRLDALEVSSKWYADGRLVSKRRGRSLHLTRALAGKRLVVVVRVAGPDGVTVVRRSLPSRPVRR